MKDAYVIYMASKKFSYYIYDAKITIKFDHAAFCKSSLHIL